MFVIAVKGVATTAMEPYSPPVLRQFVKHKKDTLLSKGFPHTPLGVRQTHYTKLSIAQASGRDNQAPLLHF